MVLKENVMAYNNDPRNNDHRDPGNSNNGYPYGQDGNYDHRQQDGDHYYQQRNYYDDNSPYNNDQGYNNQGNDYQPGSYQSQNDYYQNNQQNQYNDPYQGTPMANYDNQGQNQQYANYYSNKYGNRRENLQGDGTSVIDRPFINTESFSQYLSRVFLLMFFGLAITAIVAVAIPYNYNLLMWTLNFFAGPGMMITLVAYLAIAIFFGVAVKKMNPALALGLFILYAVMTGFTFSILTLVFTTDAIWKAFLAASVFFGVMALYGVTTKRDLTQMRTILMIGLISLIVATIVNIFLRSPVMDYIISYVGVLVFAAYTAYDVNKLKLIYQSQPQERVLSAMAVYGAFQLYLDFINLFIYLLRIFGRTGRD